MKSVYEMTTDELYDELEEYYSRQPLDNEDVYEYLDDEHDAWPTRKGGQVNNRMGTLNRQAGIINRYRKQGVLR